MAETATTLNELIQRAREQARIPVPEIIALIGESEVDVERLLEAHNDLVGFLDTIFGVRIPEDVEESDEDVEESDVAARLAGLEHLTQGLESVSGANGVLAKYGPEGLHVWLEDKRPEPELPHLGILYGKATTAWDSDAPNKITLRPCDKDGTVIGPATNTVICFIHAPADAATASVEIAEDDVLQYLRIPQTTDADDTVEGLLVSPNSAGGAFLVFLTKDFGVSGGSGVDCTYKYTVKMLDDSTELGTTMSPEQARIADCAYWYAGETRTDLAGNPASSRYGLAAYDGTTLKLLVAFGEAVQSDACL